MAPTIQQAVKVLKSIGIAPAARFAAALSQEGADAVAIFQEMQKSNSHMLSKLGHKLEREFLSEQGPIPSVKKEEEVQVQAEVPTQESQDVVEADPVPEEVQPPVIVEDAEDVEAVEIAEEAPVKEEEKPAEEPKKASKKSGKKSKGLVGKIKDALS